MKFGAWIHSNNEPSLDELILQASAAGLESIRSYGIEYSRKVAATLQAQGMSLLAGMHIDSEALLKDWRSQVRVAELADNFELGVQLEAICVGNELREGGDAFDKKVFSGKLAENLAHVLDAYHDWMAQHGVSVPLTYANEFITFGADGEMRADVRPLFDACDIISVNHYPMEPEGWMGTEAFAINARLLQDRRTQNERFLDFEVRLRNVMRTMEAGDKTLYFSETGFPSAIGWHIEGEAAPGKPLYVPVHDREHFEAALRRFIGIIRKVNCDYDDRIKALYFYEWRDNYYHNKIWNIENSPIHTAFGLCDREGNPKLNISALIQGES